MFPQVGKFGTRGSESLTVEGSPSTHLLRNETNVATKLAPPTVNGLNEPDWTSIEHSSAFRSLIAAKMRFIIPAVIFFVAYYFALPILVGYFPAVMERKVVGQINVAYLFALSEFVMAWLVMAIYVMRARGFDDQAAHVIDEQRGVIRP